MTHSKTLSQYIQREQPHVQDIKETFYLTTSIQLNNHFRFNQFSGQNFELTALKVLFLTFECSVIVCLWLYTKRCQNLTYVNMHRFNASALREALLSERIFLAIFGGEFVVVKHKNTNKRARSLFKLYHLLDRQHWQQQQQSCCCDT